MNIEFRWLVIEDKYRDWDSRWDEYQLTSLKRLPTLQWRFVVNSDTATEWQTVPTVIEPKYHYDPFEE